ncbi:MAG: FAD-binding oxidoreductase [Chromatiales bacterium]
MALEQSHDVELFIDALRRRSGSDVLTDHRSLEPYATDASPYHQLPAAVVRPRDVENVVAIAQLATEFGVPLIPRGGGTSLAGQCVGTGVIVDMGWHQKAILSFDPGMRRVTVQPGVVRDVLNRHLQPHGLIFAPDPSTTDRCQIGGMAGNNAWGLHALRYGTTRDHVIAMDAVLADGTLVNLRGMNDVALEKVKFTAGHEGEIYREVIGTVTRHAEAIVAGYPSLRGIPNNAGYALDVLLRGQPWERAGPRFNLAPLLCGAEGTLALVTSVTLKLVERPIVCRLLCLHFDSVELALDAVPGVLATQPAALELLDRAILRVAAAHEAQRANCFWLQGDPGAVLIVEYSGQSAEAVSTAAEQARRERGARPCTVVEGAKVEQAWALRRAALSMLMEPDSGLDAVTGIEDAAVSAGDLRAYFGEVQQTLEQFGLPFFVYGPVGMGVLHVRPVLRLDSAAAVTRYERLLDAAAAIAVRYRGLVFRQAW